jgi:hypothetical protein
MPTTTPYDPDEEAAQTGDAAWAAGAWALTLSFLAWLWVA